MYRASRSRTSHRVDQEPNAFKATRQPSELLPVSEIPNVVVERNFLSHTSFLKPKFFLSLPKINYFFKSHLSRGKLFALIRSLHLVKLSTFFRQELTIMKVFLVVEACRLRQPSDVSVIFHTNLTLGSYFISPSTLRYSRYLN